MAHCYLSFTKLPSGAGKGLLAQRIHTGVLSQCQLHLAVVLTKALFKGMREGEKMEERKISEI